MFRKVRVKRWIDDTDFGNGAGGGGSGIPSGFTPCDCCRANDPPPICDRLADFDCSNCEAGSNQAREEEEEAALEGEDFLEYMKLR